MKRTFLPHLAVLFALSIPDLQATQPARWTTSTQRGFLEGKLQGISVTSDGTLVPAPAMSMILDAEEAFVYAAAIDRGGVLYLGTGNNGRIFRVTPAGEASSWAKLEEPGVYALAVDSLNRLYAATAPDGKVYRLDDQGQAQIFYDPDQKFIWDLSLDQQNNLFVATGPQGIIYRVNPQGRGEIFYDSRETHIITLEQDRDGNLLAGTDPGGLVIRISADGTPFVLHDSPLREIKSIAVDRYGNIYAAALSTPTSEPSAQPSSRSGSPDPGEENENQTGAEVTVRIAGIQGGSRAEVYRIDKENGVETLYSSDEEMVFDLLVRSNGNLLVATGDRGRLLSIDPQRFVTLLVETTEQQVTQLVEREGGGLYAATSNLGKVFQLQPQPSREGVYQSRALDAGTLARWGRIRWQSAGVGSPTVRLYTRSGNTGEPDETWTAWSPPYTNPEGDSVASAAARFLQWKLEFLSSQSGTSLSSASPAVALVEVTYMQQNRPPRVTAVTVHPPGLAFAANPTVNPGGGIPPGGPDQAHVRSLPPLIRQQGVPSAPPRRIYTPGARSISWAARDSNGDDLTYTLYYRSQGESGWSVLKKDLLETYYTLDAVSFPDGTYLIKVVASDRLSNPPGQALLSELVSKPFVIANSSPVVILEAPQVQGRRALLRFQARTGASVVYQAEYSVDAGEWAVVFPEDGIADSDAEAYALNLEDLGSGEHDVSIRVVDSVGNIATAKTRLVLP